MVASSAKGRRVYPSRATCGSAQTNRWVTPRAAASSSAASMNGQAASACAAFGTKPAK